ncbi:DNA polymerase III subunit delta' C-terminal domain-containing protein [Nitrosomonas sp. ANs5]|uniref:DNA polymerase III subunit delta' C-terminal domain-containing protein n=1 Tax=Nitrosomonas sp. ANs5 TaxID=3423941 RepID=UPI003D3431E6
MRTAAIYPWQQTLWQQIRRQGVLRAHALLLTGRAGIGKLAWALSLAKAMLCEQVDQAGRACGHCPGCHWFELGQHPNFRLLEPEASSLSVGEADNEGRASKPDATDTKSRKKPSQQIGIAQIRVLDDFIYLSGHQDRFKLVLISPAEAMNAAAANALLKKLEEPPPNVLFILVTHRGLTIPATIRSRCQQIAMPQPARGLARDWLVQQGAKHPDYRLAMSGYAPLLALQYDEDYWVQHADFVRHVAKPNELDPIELAEKLHKLDLSSVVSWLQKWCYDLMSCRMTGSIRYHLAQEATIKRLAAAINPIDIAFLWRDLIALQQLARHSLNAKLFVEEMLLTYINSVVPKGIQP